MSEHFLYLKDKIEKDIFVLAGPILITDYSNFGVGILRANSIEEAWKLSEGDPAVINRVMRLDILPFGISQVQKGYKNS
jgi:uncharacterized protein YciI